MTMILLVCVRFIRSPTRPVARANHLRSSIMSIFQPVLILSVLRARPKERVERGGLRHPGPGGGPRTPFSSSLFPAVPHGDRTLGRNSNHLRNEPAITSV